MNQEYQRLLKRYERIFTPRIYRAIKKQVDEYLKQGRLDAVTSDPVIEVLEKLYTEVGGKWAYKTDQQIRRDLGLPKLRFNERIANIIRQQYGPELLNMSNNIAETTKDHIRTILQNSIERNLTLEQIRAEIQSTGVSEARARVIARTETVRAANAGAMVNANEKGYVLQKKWFSVMDNRTRHDHETLDGQTVDKDQPFTVVDKNDITQKLMFPGDSSLGATPEQTINCRCSMQFLAKPEAQRKPRAKPAEPKPVEPPKPTPVQPAPEPTQQTVEAKTMEEGKQIAKRLLSKIENIEIGDVEFGANLDLSGLNERLKQLDLLINKYKPLGWDKNKILLRFASTEGSFGFIQFERDIYKNLANKLRVINFGDRTARVWNAEDRAIINVERKYSTITRQDEDIKTIELSEKSSVDEKNKNITTTTHEFAHILACTLQPHPFGSTNQKIAKEFWQEVEQIRSDYDKELLKAKVKRDEPKLDEIYLGEYADVSIDEFWAEGFKEYILHSKPSPYAIRLGFLAEKYFRYGSK